MNTKNTPTPVELDDFESADSVIREVEHKGKTKSYQFKELTKAEATSVFDLNNSKGERDPNKLRELTTRVVCAAVADVDGTPLSPQRVEKMNVNLVNKLQKIALEVNGFGAEAETEAGEG